MTDFGKLFKETADDFIIYQGKKLVLSDRFPVKNKDTLLVNIEKTNSNLRQGIIIDILGECEINGEHIKQGKGLRVQFWQDTLDKANTVTVFTKKGYVWIYNMCEVANFYLISDDHGNPITRDTLTVDFCHNGAAMIVEEIENGRRYYCSDVIENDNFENIVFTVKKI